MDHPKPHFQHPLPPEIAQQLAAARIAAAWNAPAASQPLPQSDLSRLDLKPYLQVMNREIYLLSLQGQVPIRFLSGAKIPLRDRIWARYQTFRRFLSRLRNR